MPAAKRQGHEGRTVEWPWSDRGRSAVTRESVVADIQKLLQSLPNWACRVDVDEVPRLIVAGQGWK